MNDPVTVTTSAPTPPVTEAGAVPQPLLEFVNVGFAYADGRPVLDGFSLQLQRGGFCSVLGPSGSGKTTLLYLAAGLRSPTSGSVLLDGKKVTGPSRRTGLLLQDYGLLPWYTARRNLEAGLAMSGVPPARRRELAAHWLDRLELSPLAEKFPAQLSGGQRQRVALARQFALSRELLLLDEPLSAVDELSREQLQRTLAGLVRDAGSTVLLVTHSIEEAALLSSTVLLVTGHAPLTSAELLETPFAGQLPDRDDPAFLAFCAEIRRKLAP